MMLTSICNVQHRVTKKPTCLEAFVVSSVCSEFLRLIVMAWKILDRQVVPMDTPLTTLNTLSEFTSESTGGKMP